MFCVSLFVLFVLYLLTIVLSVLRFTASDYPFGICKLFLGTECIGTKSNHRLAGAVVWWLDLQLPV